MREFGAALAVSVLLVTSACGGADARPSEGEISKALQKGAKGSVLGESGTKVSKQSADCIAKVLEESEISDKALTAIVEGQKNYKATKADREAAVKVAGPIVKCLPAGLN